MASDPSRPYAKWHKHEVLRRAAIMLFSLGHDRGAWAAVGWPIARAFLEARASGRSAPRLVDRPTSPETRAAVTAILTAADPTSRPLTKKVANAIMADAVRAFCAAAPTCPGPADERAMAHAITMLEVLLPWLQDMHVRPGRGRPSKLDKTLRADPQRLLEMHAASKAPGGPPMLARARADVQQSRKLGGKRADLGDKEARAVAARRLRRVKKLAGR